MSSQKNNLMFNEIKVKTLFKSRTKRKDLSLPLINDSSEEKNEPKKRRERKINYYSLFKPKELKRRNKGNSSLILNNSSEQEKVSSFNPKEYSRNKNTFFDILLHYNF